jgi:Protein of unknown function with HXXEE motif
MTGVGKTYLGLGVVQALHSMEEMHAHLYDFFWTATGLFQRYIPILPRFKMSAEVFAILNMGFIGIILATAPFVESKRTWAIKFAWCCAVVEVLNGLLHLTGAVVFSAYVPGALSAPLLLIVGLILIVQLARQRIIKITAAGTPTGFNENLNH